MKIIKSFIWNHGRKETTQSKFPKINLYSEIANYKLHNAFLKEIHWFRNGIWKCIQIENITVL